MGVEKRELFLTHPGSFYLLEGDLEDFFLWVLVPHPYRLDFLPFPCPSFLALVFVAVEAFVVAAVEAFVAAVEAFVVAAVEAFVRLVLFQVLVLVFPDS